MQGYKEYLANQLIVSKLEQKNTLNESGFFKPPWFKNWINGRFNIQKVSSQPDVGSVV